MAETRNNFKIQFIGLDWNKRREILKEIETTDLEIGGGIMNTFQKVIKGTSYTETLYGF